MNLDLRKVLSLEQWRQLKSLRGPGGGPGDKIFSGRCCRRVKWAEAFLAASQALQERCSNSPPCRWTTDASNRKCEPRIPLQSRARISTNPRGSVAAFSPC